MTHDFFHKHTLRNKGFQALLGRVGALRGWLLEHVFEDVTHVGNYQRSGSLQRQATGIQYSSHRQQEPQSWFLALQRQHAGSWLAAQPNKKPSRDAAFLLCDIFISRFHGELHLHRAEVTQVLVQPWWLALLTHLPLSTHAHTQRMQHINGA